MKLCKDCKHHVPSSEARYDRCARATDRKSFIDGRIALVRGDQEPTALGYCSNNRGYGFIEALLFNRCGENARWFEAAMQLPQEGIAE